jgi:hypothetical protein
VFESDFQPMPRTLLLDPGIDAGCPDRQTGARRGEWRVACRTCNDGVLTLRADRLGVTQRPDQWMLVSGDAQFKLGERVLDVLGQASRLDAGYWELAKSGTPQLSEDVRDQAPGHGTGEGSGAGSVVVA